MLLVNNFALSGGSAPKNSFFSFVIVFFVLVFIVNLIYLASFRRFSKYLQEKHPEEAQAFQSGLGQSMTNPSGKSLTMLYRYFWNKQYESVNDETLNKFGQTTRGLLIFALALFVLLFLAIIISVVIGNK